MMKWLRLFIPLTAFLVLLIPSYALADSSQDVTVTATGYICEAPGGFTLTYVSDYEIGVSWEKGEDAVNTMVRVKSGGSPQSRDDGYLVYYGGGTSCTDTNIVLASFEMPYYWAWSQDINGVWEEVGSSKEADFMSASFLFIGFILLAAVLTYFALKISLLLFRMAAALAWVGLGIWLLLSDSTNLQMSDTWTQVLGMVFIVMAIAVLSLQMRTDIRHETQMRGKQGYPGASTESWTSWGPNPKKKKQLTASERQAEYKTLLRSKRGGR